MKFTIGWFEHAMMFRWPLGMLPHSHGCRLAWSQKVQVFGIPFFFIFFKLYTSQTWILRAFLSDTSLAKSTSQFARFNLTHHLVVVSRNSVFHQTVTLPSHQFLAQKSLKKTWRLACLKCLVHRVPNILSQMVVSERLVMNPMAQSVKKIHQTYHQIQVIGG